MHFFSYNDNSNVCKNFKSVLLLFLTSWLLAHHCFFYFIFLFAVYLAKLSPPVDCWNAFLELLAEKCIITNTWTKPIIRTTIVKNIFIWMFSLLSLAFVVLYDNDNKVSKSNSEPVRADTQKYGPKVSSISRDYNMRTGSNNQSHHTSNWHKVMSLTNT